MNKSLLSGVWRFLSRIPQPIWQQEVARSARAVEKWHAFMTEAHHRVQDFVVRELFRLSQSIPPEAITQRLQRGCYLTLAQSACLTPNVQGSIFGFPCKDT